MPSDDGAVFLFSSILQDATPVCMQLAGSIFTHSAHLEVAAFHNEGLLPGRFGGHDRC
jgi:hypothetical protein